MVLICHSFHRKLQLRPIHNVQIKVKKRMYAQTHEVVQKTFDILVPTMGNSTG